MPLVPTALISTIKASIDTNFGPIPGDLDGTRTALADLFRTKLATAIASGDVFTVATADVKVGIAVQVSTSTGLGATTAIGLLE